MPTNPVQLQQIYNILMQKAQTWQQYAVQGNQLSQTIGQAKADAYQDAANVVQNIISTT